MQEVIWKTCRIEDSLAHSHWGEDAQVRTVQLFIQSGFPPKSAHYEAHWGEATPV